MICIHLIRSNSASASVAIEGTSFVCANRQMCPSAHSLYTHDHVTHPGGKPLTDWGRALNWWPWTETHEQFNQRVRCVFCVCIRQCAHLKRPACICIIRCNRAFASVASRSQSAKKSSRRPRCVYLYIHVRVFVCIYICIHMYIYTYHIICMLYHIYVIYICRWRYGCMYLFMRMYIYIYLYIYV